MKIQYASDLHLKYKENKNYLKEHPLQPSGEILVLNGDIIPFNLMDQAADFFDFISDHFRFVYWIPGNHEYYHSDIAEKGGSLFEKIRSNVFLVNNTFALHGHTKLIFSTLWSKISKEHEEEIGANFLDFKKIKYEGGPFLPKHFNRLHKEALAFIKKETEHTDEKHIVVFTHHVPTLLHYPEEFVHHPHTEAFASELKNFIEISDIQCWVYGHHHHNHLPFRIGKTLMLSNQLGYVIRHENVGFRPDALLEF